MILLTILIVVVILGLLIFVHELGHFIMARRAGMKVEEFGFGFPPRMFGIKKGGTIYSINWIPLGGFVRILGENGESTEKGSFNTKPSLARFFVLIAGVTMNVILAWVLISIALMIGLPTLVSQGQELPSYTTATESKVTVLFVDPESPAEKAGLKMGDIINAIEGVGYETVQEIQDVSSTKSGQQIAYTVTRGDRTLDLGIIPRVNPPEGEGPIGISLGTVSKVSYPWWAAFPVGMKTTFLLLVNILIVFWSLVKSIFGDQSLLGAVSGPVGIAVIARDMAQLGFANLLQFAAVLSVNLAIINVAPFPALDGGRILFLFIEKIQRKKIKPIVEGYANTIGFLLLILLMVWVTVRDVNKFSGQLDTVWEKIISIF
ncbi:MAG: RIP metalloprotease RseP [Candidatus Doudnabacteria bacterium CG10_big_fil_rev_8_21_14_0_10_41_10]|uniref:RIP metalloprotease RseP n=1 Tax=Candidatus Doudnabacteria bacterium CG10_big_fil_rev_8_21_14_0_10_41_10 TaxID=1974551 RepID=A0A2H0VCA0_9BACT|nr:MAG: RIP metalloprotease RseP [Candidatus Doudnabacteria bacterium CG10_big_fil_rev_8_21_14_0_10_41_10]